MALRIIDLSGDPYDMGYAHGQQLADQVHGLAQERYRLCVEGKSASRDDVLALARKHLEVQAQHAPEVHREFCGIADGAKIAPEELLIGNGYTDFKDVLASSAPHECTSFLVRPAAAANGRTYLGQTWDMHGSAEAFVVVLRRKPSHGPQSITLTTAGCLSLVGMNEHGLAIGNNNLTPTDPRPGMIYLAMIHDFLNQRSFPRAQAAITDAPRASGHNYYMADAAGHVLDVETTARRFAAIDPAGNTYAHANHYEAAELKQWEAQPPGQSTLARKARLAALLSAAEGEINVARLHQCLSDTEGGEHGSICRHGQACTCAAAVMCPQERELFLCQGTPDTNPLVRVEFE